jgi:hypothetical protein
MKVLISLSASSKAFEAGQKVALRESNNVWLTGKITKAGRTKVTFMSTGGEEYTISGDDLKYLKPITKSGKKTPYTNAEIKALFPEKGATKISKVDKAEEKNPSLKVKRLEQSDISRLVVQGVLNKGDAPNTWVINKANNTLKLPVGTVIKSQDTEKSSKKASGKPKTTQKGSTKEPAAKTPEDKTKAGDKLGAAALKSIVKELKLPGGAKAKIDSNGYKWSKRGGQADNILRPLYASLRTSSTFKKVDSKAADVPDGSSSSSIDRYTNGTHVLELYARYGNTASDNNFSITLTPVAKAEEETKPAEKPKAEPTKDISPEERKEKSGLIYSIKQRFSMASVDAPRSIKQEMREIAGKHGVPSVKDLSVENSPSVDKLKALKNELSKIDL